MIVTHPNPGPKLSPEDQRALDRRNFITAALILCFIVAMLAASFYYRKALIPVFFKVT